MGAVMFTVTHAPTAAFFTVTVGAGINGVTGYLPPTSTIGVIGAAIVGSSTVGP